MADVRKLVSTFEGSYGIDRIEWYTIQEIGVGGSTRTETRFRTVTDWWTCSGTLTATDYPLGTISTQVYAGFEYPRIYVNDAMRTADVLHVQQLICDDDSDVCQHNMKMKFGVDGREESGILRKIFILC